VETEPHSDFRDEQETGTEPEPVTYYRSFNATVSRQNIVRRLVLEYAGVELKISPTPRSEDFQRHIELWFTSAEQGESFMSRMLELGLQELNRRERGHNN